MSTADDGVTPIREADPTALLDATFARLGFNQGQLLSANDKMSTENRVDWVEKGDWLSLAKLVGAEKIFFVDQNPVIVFARADTSDVTFLRELYNRIWCMARPQLLFLACPGDLSVYDLTKAPVAHDESIEARDRLISERVRSIAEVQSKLATFRREEIESGRFFETPRFEGGINRADKALIRDLRIVRQQLLDGGLPARHADSLIGRSIFIRYLEDRAILLPEYFDNLARSNRRWSRILRHPLITPGATREIEEICYLRVLQDHAFTYRLFDQLARDFNGDMFPVDEAEKAIVTSEHLHLLRDLLTGNTSPQQQLFFYAYRFDVIPIELISSIYEEFYNDQHGKANHGSHYTPSALVDFLLARTLTEDVLAKKPRILDPACGSGIFLVEAFRRIVRYQMWERGGEGLSRSQLRKILRERIAGIDINDEAVRVAAFSLYLAFLHYQEPREINEQRRLPNLKWREDTQDQRTQYFNILLHGNAFDLRREHSEAAEKRFGEGSADVILGNPPWGYPKPDDALGRAALKSVLAWCDEKNVTIGDNELSQAFLHLSAYILRDNGRCGFLVSTGVFFKQHENSRRFRNEWLSRTQLEHVVNFAQVRHLFFRGPARKAEAVAPFAAVIFSKEFRDPAARFQYWSAKRTALIEKTQAVILSRADMNWLSQRDCMDYEPLWKIYWWAGHRDEALIRSLERFNRLSDFSQVIPGAKITPNIGFVEGEKGKIPGQWLEKYKVLPVSKFVSYGPLPLDELIPAPTFVRRRGAEDAYRGHRLLVRRGIESAGRLAVRLEHQSFSFTHSIFSFRLHGLADWQEKVLLGIFWSDLARYYLFLTSGSWGMWHDELTMTSISRMPIAMPRNEKAASQLLRTVNELRCFDHTASAHFRSMWPRASTLTELERELNNAVFNLYELNAAERDLITDMCTTGLDFLYKKQTSSAASPLPLPSTRTGIADQHLSSPETEIEEYIHLFSRHWFRDLDLRGKLRWQLFCSSAGAQILALVFSTRSDEFPGKVGQDPQEPTDDWNQVLHLISKSSRQPIDTKQIYVDSFIRLITEKAMVLMKRNERRFWTRSAAREDAEAIQLKAMVLQGALRQ